MGRREELRHLNREGHAPRMAVAATTSTPSGQVLEWDAALGGFKPVDPGGVGSAQTYQAELFTPADDQTQFVLPQAPDSGTVQLHVNGQVWPEQVSAVSVAGLTVTWSGPYSISSEDQVLVTYMTT